MNVLIVDDEPPARDRLRELLNRLSDYETCGEAGNGMEALRLAARLQPDIVLLDIQMPGLNGLETARRLVELVRCWQHTPPSVLDIAYCATTAGYGATVAHITAAWEQHLNRPVTVHH